MGLSMEVLNGLGSGVGVGEGAIGAFTGGAFALVSVLKAMHRVEAGQVGLRTFGGRPKIKRNGHYSRVEPGLRWAVPFTHSIEIMDVRWQPTPINELFIDRNDINTQYRVLASFIWRVSPEGDNPGLGRYKANGIENIVPEICFSGLRNVMTNVPIEQITDETVVQAQVNELCSERLANYGTEMDKLNLISVAQSIGSQLKPADLIHANGNGVNAAIAAGAVTGFGG